MVPLAPTYLNPTPVPSRRNMLRLCVISSQYSAQLKVWGLRTYKNKDTILTNSELIESNVLRDRGTEATPSIPTRQACTKLDIVSRSGSGMQTCPHYQILGPRLTSVQHRPIFERLEENDVNDDQKQAATGAGRLISPPSNEASPHSRDVDDDARSEWSLLPSQGVQLPWSAGKSHPHFTASKTMQNSVRGVVHALSAVFADSELDEFFGKLTNTELEELLTDDVKLNEARNNALLKYAGKRLRLGEFCDPRPTRLDKILRGKSIGPCLLLAYESCSVTLLEDRLDLLTRQLH